jgi:hypothetical protein
MVEEAPEAHQLQKRERGGGALLHSAFKCKAQINNMRSMILLLHLDRNYKVHSVLIHVQTGQREGGKGGRGSLNLQNKT